MIPAGGLTYVGDGVCTPQIYRAALRCEQELQPLLQSPSGPAAAVIAYTLPQDHQELTEKRSL